MLSIALALAAAFALAAIVQVVAGLMFVRQFFVAPPAGFEEGQWPKAAVLLSLRGADPQLRKTIRRLLRLDYPDYIVHVVVDSEEDPAWEVVRQAAEEAGAGPLTLTTLTDRTGKCGLQCGAFVQAAKGLDDTVDVVVTIDGDVIVHETWLRELVAPLRDERVGATFGNRWFIPTGAEWGSLVRYIWNLAAVTPMYLFEIPWGGALAIRRSTMDTTNLIERWSKAIVHDAPIKHLLDEQGLRLQFVPSLMMPIRENCRLGFCLDFLKRQMMWTRIYHPNWLLVLSHAVASTLLVAAAIVLACVEAANGHWPAAALSGGSLAGYLLVMLIMIVVLEAGVRRSLRWRRLNPRWLSTAKVLKMPPAILLTMAVYLVAVLLANFGQRVTWRGVRYWIRSQWDVQILVEQRFDQTNRSARESL
ncbi:MAG: glycosyltransferase family 2 protein [Pirellulaceae bacterium]